MEKFITEKAMEEIADKFAEITSKGKPDWVKCFAQSPDISNAVLIATEGIVSDLFQYCNLPIKDLEIFQAAFEKNSSANFSMIAHQQHLREVVQCVIDRYETRLDVISELTFADQVSRLEFATIIIGILGAIKCANGTLTSKEQKLVSDCFRVINTGFSSGYTDMHYSDFLISDGIINGHVWLLVDAFIGLYAFNYEHFRAYIKASFAQVGVFNINCNILEKGYELYSSLDDTKKNNQNKKENVQDAGCEIHKLQTDKCIYNLIDCSLSCNSIQYALSNHVTIDGAILVVAVTDGPMAQTREHLKLARQVNVPQIVVFMNKCDQVNDPFLTEVVELEIRELLSSCGFDESSKIIKGSAQALNPTVFSDIVSAMETFKSHNMANKQDMPFCNICIIGHEKHGKTSFSSEISNYTTSMPMHNSITLQRAKPTSNPEPKQKSAQSPTQEEKLNWIRQRRCAFCGGEFEGIITKICRDCGKTKNYR